MDFGNPVASIEGDGGGWWAKGAFSPLGCNFLTRALVMPLARPVVLVTEVVIPASSHVDRDDSIDDLERSMEPNGDLSRPSTS